MVKITKSDFKILIKGLLISCVLIGFLLEPLTHMIVRYIFPNWHIEIMSFILWLRPAVFISGLYAGISNAQNKILISSLLGILYFPLSVLLALAIFDKHIDVNYTVVFGILIDGVASVIGTKIAQSIVKLRRRN